jgi:3-methyladenine DNA glycosylase/8-oxoguanine DNA glycosylase
MEKEKQLAKQATVHVVPTKPFSFEGTFFKPSHFSSKLVLYDNGRLYQAIEVDGHAFGVEIFGSSPNSQKVGITIYAPKEISNSIKKTIKREVVTRYDLDGDIGGFIEEYRGDSLLAEPIQRWGGMRPSVAYSLYGFLMVATVLQNATVKRTVHMMDVLLKQYGKKLIFAGKEVYAIWSPEDMEKVSETALRDLRIGYRAKNIKRISHSFATKQVSEELLRSMRRKQDIKEALLEIYGVGPQSVSYLLFEAFHFYDALDHLSPWEGKIVSMLLYGNKTTSPKRILKDVEKRWGKWKMLAIHYIFEDLFWRRKEECIPWLEEEIRM